MRSMAPPVFLLTSLAAYLATFWRHSHNDVSMLVLMYGLVVFPFALGYYVFSWVERCLPDKLTQHWLWTNSRGLGALLYGMISLAIMFSLVMFNIFFLPR